MGRTEQSQGLAPPAVRKSIRAKQARHIVNHVIPAILASNSKARNGVEGSELIVDPPAISKLEISNEHGDEGNDDRYVKRKGQGKRRVKQEDFGNFTHEEEMGIAESKGKVKRKGKGKNRRDDDATVPIPAPLPQEQPAPQPITVCIMSTDSLTAAQTLHPAKSSKTNQNICILNMASPLRPGGGLLNGATSQEEFLCARTTLLPSLKDTFYRLPDYGAVFTRDVLVFRDPRMSLEGPNLPRPKRWWVDVVSAGMLRFPELEGEERVLSAKDRRIVERKIRAVLRVCGMKGVKSLVAGAWGCGAYGNPVGEVAAAWRRVLRGEVRGKGKDSRESWEDVVQEVVFAIENRKMAEEFAAAFGEDVVVENGPDAWDYYEAREEEDGVAEELREKIGEMEGQIQKVWNQDLKERLMVVLQGLRSQLREREGGDGSEGEEEQDGSDENAGVQDDESFDIVDDQEGEEEEYTVSGDELPDMISQY